MNTSIQRISILGLCAVVSFGLPDAPASADLLLSSWGAQRVYNLDEDTGLPKDFPGQPGVNSFPIPRANAAMVGPDGMIYAASELDDTVYRIDPNAVPATVDDLPGLNFLGIGPQLELQEAVGLIFDRDGNLYVSDQFDGEIYQYGPSGNFLTTYDFGLGRVGGMAFLADDSGRMVVAGGGEHLIVEAGGGGHFPFSLSFPTKSGVNNGAASVAIDSNGNVLITNTGGYGTDNGVEAHTVARFDPDGNWIEDVVASTSLNTHVSGQGSHLGIIEGPEGDIFLTKKHGNDPPTTVPHSWFRFDSGGLPNTTGVPSFGGRDWNSQGGFGDEVRTVWLWDADGDGSDFTDPTTKQFVTVSSEVHWGVATSGDWDVPTNWTPDAPGSLTAVFIDPAVSLTVTGPAGPTTVSRLQVGGGAGAATLELQPGGPVTAGRTNVQFNGEIRGSGQLTSKVEGAGTLRATSGVLTVGTGGPASDFTFTGTLSADVGATLNLDYNARLDLASGVQLDGGSLAAPGGVRLPADMPLTGFGTIVADMLNEGQIAGFGGTLTFAGLLEGSGQSASGNVAFSATGAFEGEGTFGASISGAGGSRITPTGDLAIGNSANPAGFRTDGSLEVGPHTVTLRAASQAELGGTTTIEGGTLTAAGGIRVKAGGQILLDGASSTVAGGTLTNEGLVRVISGNDHQISASLDNNSGGDVTTVDDLRFSGATNTNAGRINVIGATLTFDQQVVNEPGGEINAINATLQFDGNVTNNGAMHLINTTVIGSVASPAAVHFAGDNEVTGNITGTPDLDLTIQLRDASGDHDRLAVGGSMAIGGTLTVTLQDGFDPEFGNSFVIATYGSRSGEFSPVHLPDLSADGLDWSLDYGSTELSLSVINAGPVITGDVNRDGVVDRADAALLLKNLGRTDATSTSHGDFDDDGSVTLLDLALLQGNLGAVAPPAPAASAVPEPATALLLILASVVAAAAARPRRVMP